MRASQRSNRFNQKTLNLESQASSLANQKYLLKSTDNKQDMVENGSQYCNNDDTSSMFSEVSTTLELQAEQLTVCRYSLNNKA